MAVEQPARPESRPEAAAPEGSVSAAAAALARKRWAHRQESAGEAPEPTAPVDETEIPDAPEEEQPDEELESEPQDGQDEGEPEVEGDDEEQAEEDDEVSEDEGPEEEPARSVSLDELDDDATVVIDGTEVSVAELRDQRMFQADYTRKTQALAEQRSVIQQREKLTAAFLGEQNAQLQNQFRQLQNLNWQELAQKNPQEYQAKRAQAEALQLAMDQHERKSRQFLQQIQQFEDQATRVQAQAAQKELKNKIKGWNNGLYYSLVDYATKVGFDREEVLKYTDPNVFVLLQKARLYDEAQKVTTKKAVRSSPKRTPRAKQPAPPSRKVERKTNEVFERAQKSGRIEDAVEALRAKRAAGR